MSQPTILLATEDFTGMPIISSDSGQQIGQVSDVVVDPQKQQISAFLVGSDNPQQAQAVLFKDVSEIVSNTIFVKDPQAVKPAHQAVKFEQQNGKASQLVQQKVVNKQGQELGQVVDFYFDPTKGKVKQVEYKTGQDGQSQRVRLEAKEIKFKNNFVEVKPKEQSTSQEGGNPITKVVTSLKEKIT